MLPLRHVAPENPIKFSLLVYVRMVSTKPISNSNSSFIAPNLHLLRDSKVQNTRKQPETLQGSAPLRKTETRPENYGGYAFAKR